MVWHKKLVSIRKSKSQIPQKVLLNCFVILIEDFVTVPLRDWLENKKVPATYNRKKQFAVRSPLQAAAFTFLTSFPKTISLFKEIFFRKFYP